MAAKLLRRFILVLLWPTQVAKVVAYATAIINSFTNNTYFPTPSPTLAVIGADLASFIKCLAAAKTRAEGTADALEAAEAKLKLDFQHLLAYAQIVIDDADSSLWAVMGASTGFSQEKVGKRVPAASPLSWGDISGWIVIKVLSLGADTTYFFQYSLDQKTWVSMTPTHHCTATAKGLTPGTTYWFRWQALTGKPEYMTDWSTEYSILVK